MGPALGDLAVVEHDDLVGRGDGREAVGDDDRGAVRGDSVERRLDRLLGAAVERGLVASSRIRIGGSLSKVRAIATRCFSPPDSFRPRSPTID